MRFSKKLIDKNKKLFDAWRKNEKDPSITEEIFNLNTPLIVRSLSRIGVTEETCKRDYLDWHDEGRIVLFKSMLKYLKIKNPDIGFELFASRWLNYYLHKSLFRIRHIRRDKMALSERLKGIEMSLNLLK